MTLALWSLGVISLIELVLWLPGVWRIRRPVACGLIITLSVVGGLLIGIHFTAWTSLILILSLYRIINLLRLVQGRSQTDYLFQVARQSSLLLMAVQLVVLGLAGLNHFYLVPTVDWLYGLAVLQLCIAAVLVSSTVRHLRTTKPPVLERSYADRDLPTLTVAIPARNETEELEACLQSLTNNTYPKLEILVLDDCSQNKQTPEIIRQFAHDGVRFIAGEVPPEQWLAKNYAYQQLADAASGELLLFCGVDTRFEADSLRAMVEALLQKKKTMLSVIPRNASPSSWQWEALMVQPGRYAWELALPRRWLNRPPVLSTCWLITAAALHAAGSFRSISHTNSVESYFARATAGQHDGYSFLQSDAIIGLATAKPFPDQRATAIRTRYPQLHRRPELVGLLSLIELATLVAPFTSLIGSLATHSWLLTLLSAIVCVLLTTFYAKIVSLTYRRFLLRSLWLLPFSVLYDIGLLNYSMWQYEFGEIIWKGRNVCLPVMRAIPSLPKLT